MFGHKPCNELRVIQTPLKENRARLHVLPAEQRCARDPGLHGAVLPHHVCSGLDVNNPTKLWMGWDRGQKGLPGYGSNSHVSVDDEFKRNSRGKIS